MAYKVQTDIKRATLLLYLTIGLAVIQSAYMELIATDNGHQILSTYFFIETVILGLTIFLGLKNKWTQTIITLLALTEAVLFFLDTPISPDELLMIIIFGIRAFVLIGLFSKTINRYYSNAD